MSKPAIKQVKKRRKAPTPDAQLKYVTDSFLSDLDCLREMYGLVVPVLKKKDQVRSEKLTQIINSLEKVTNQLKASEGLSRQSTIKLMNDAQALRRTAFRLGRGSTLFRRHALVALVSRYDEFLSDILRAIFQAYPNRFENPEKTLSYHEIMQLKTPKQALEKFIDKEVDSIIRESHQYHISYLEKQLKLELQQKIHSWKDFIELTERRNLFVHTGGIVSAQYIQICKSQGITLTPDLTQGKPLSVTSDYFENAYRCLFEVGLRIGQSAHRALWPKQIAKADAALLTIGYDKLLDEEWDLAQLAFDIGLSFPIKLISDDNTRKIFLIDKCISLDRKREKKEMRQLLESVDWSAAGSKFLLAVAVLKGEFKQAEKIMSLMGTDSPIREQEFRTWPLFQRFRQTSFFRRAFKKVYGKDFRIRLEPDDRPTIPTEEIGIQNIPAIPVELEKAASTI